MLEVVSVGQYQHAGIRVDLTLPTMSSDKVNDPLEGHAAFAPADIDDAALAELGYEGIYYTRSASSSIEIASRIVQARIF